MPGMNVKKVIVDALTVFSVTLVVSAAVSLLWSLIVHRTRTIDWETSFRFAILLGIIVPWITMRRSKEQ
jgi:hypothetical protein